MNEGAAEQREDMRNMRVPDKYQKPVEEFVKKALEQYKDKIDSILLFGSVARGEAREDSDVDILVVGEVNLEELVDISFPILLEHGEVISAKNMDREHFDFLVREGYSFARNVLKEGMVLYERMGKTFRESRREAKVSKSSV